MTARDTHRLMERGQSANGHRQGQQNLVAILPLTVERQEAARLRGEDIPIHSGGGADCPIRNAQMNRERCALLGMHDDADRAVFRISLSTSMRTAVPDRR